MKLQEAIELYNTHCIYEKNLSNKTMKAYNIDLNQFKAYRTNQNLTVGVFDKFYIKDYMKHLFDDNLKAKSVKRKVGTLKTFFSFLEFEDIIEISPFKKMKFSIRLPQMLPKTINTKDLRKFFKYMYKYKHSLKHKNSYSYNVIIRDIAVIELLYATGMRVSELCNLKLGDIDIHKGIVTIFGKGSKERIIQVCDPEVKQALSEYHKIFAVKIHENNHFFINKFNTMFSEDSVRYMITKYQEKSGIKKQLTPHQFRHTLATGLLEENVDIRVIQNILGHSSILTTQIYTRVNSKLQKKILSTKHPRKNLNLNI